MLGVGNKGEVSGYKGLQYTEVSGGLLALAYSLARG